MRVPRDLPAGTVVTGAWPDRSPVADLPDDLRRFLDGGDPPVVITFGSMGSVSGDAAASGVTRLAAGGRRVVVQAPMPDSPADPRVMSIGAVDHRGLFPRASVVVHHGGAGTTHAACAAGVPSVIVPHVGDQRYWADRLHRLGAAPPPLLVDRVDGEGLAAAVDAAVDDSRFLSAARRLAAALALEDGTSAAIGHIRAAAGAS